MTRGSKTNKTRRRPKTPRADCKTLESSDLVESRCSKSLVQAQRRAPHCEGCAPLTLVEMVNWSKWPENAWLSGFTSASLACLPHMLPFKDYSRPRKDAASVAGSVECKDRCYQRTLLANSRFTCTKSSEDTSQSNIPREMPFNTSLQTSILTPRQKSRWTQQRE